jgi:hypothetical protein
MTWIALLRCEESSDFVGPQPFVEFRCGVTASADGDTRALWSLGTLWLLTGAAMLNGLPAGAGNEPRPQDRFPAALLQGSDDHGLVWVV